MMRRPPSRSLPSAATNPRIPISLDGLPVSVDRGDGQTYISAGDTVRGPCGERVYAGAEEAASSANPFRLS